MTDPVQVAARRRVDLMVALAQAERELDGAQQAALHQELAALLAQLGDFEQALPHARSAMRLHDAGSRPKEGARARYALALLEAQASRDPERARPYLEHASLMLHDHADHALEGRALAHLSTLELRARRFNVAAERMAQAAHAFASAGQVERVLDALRSRAFLLQLDGRPADAFQALTEALDLARRHDRGADLLRLRLDLHLLSSNPLVAPELAPEDLDALLIEASGDKAAEGQLRLARAAERARIGDLDGAGVEAEAARRVALSLPDPLLYLMSCLQLAELSERRGDHLATLNVLFTCQASLGAKLGDAARVPVLMVIDALEGRWGKARFASEMARYRVQHAGS